jgi:hypothetical protein
VVIGRSCFALDAPGSVSIYHWLSELETVQTVRPDESRKTVRPAWTVAVPIIRPLLSRTVVFCPTVFAVPRIRPELSRMVVLLPGAVLVAAWRIMSSVPGESVLPAFADKLTGMTINNPSRRMEIPFMAIRCSQDSDASPASSIQGRILGVDSGFQAYCTSLRCSRLLWVAEIQRQQSGNKPIACALFLRNKGFVTPTCSAPVLGGLGSIAMESIWPTRRRISRLRTP